MKKFALVFFSLILFSTLCLAAGIVLEPVESSLISRAGYDAENQRLAIQMVENADTYYYTGVSQAVYDGFLAAESKGAYFVENIKGKYEEDMAR
jgi:hypothetical protein